MLNWMSVLWLSTICTATLLGLFHLSIWIRQRRQLENAVLAGLSFMVAFCGIVELRALGVQTPAAYAECLRWIHVFASLIIVSVVIYVQMTVPGRRWLALMVYGSRAVVIIVNFTTGVSLSFLQIDALRWVTGWGDVSFAVPVGSSNPWFLFAQLTNLLTFGYLIDAMFRLSQQAPSAPRRRQMQTLAAILVFLFIAVGSGIFIVLALGAIPVMVSIPFLIVALALSYHLVGDMLRAAELTYELQRSNSTAERFGSDLQLAEHAVGLGQWRWQAHNRQFWLSERSARLFGFDTGGEFDQDMVSARVEPEDLARMQASFAAGEPAVSREFNAEFRIVRAADSERRWLAGYGRIHFGASGKPVQAHGVIVDLTDHRAVGEVFRLVFEATPNAMLLVNEQGHIVLANIAAAELSGFAVSELLGMNIDALVPDEFRDGHGALRNSYAAAATRRQMRPAREVHLRTQSGAGRVVEVTLNPIQINGKSMVVVVVNDIGSRLSRERELAIQRSAMAHVARVGMLAELSGSLAHEINQPLAAILSNAQASLRFLGRAPADLDEIRDGLVQVVESAKRAGEVIRRLRAMLRNDAPDFTKVAANDMIREVVHLLHSELIERGTMVTEEYADDLPLARGDRVQLQQVVLNLITNAADAMADLPPPRRVRLTTRSVDEGILIQVSDRGPGVPAAERERIFQAFVTSKATGLGFGLALCKSLVDAHGGRIWVSDNPSPGPGACFHLLLPRAD